jgi:CRP-like cAMP-binding protein
MLRPEVLRRPADGVLQTHPVFQVLPDAAQAVFASDGRIVRSAAGVPCSDNRTVKLLMSGAVGVFPADADVCIGLCGPGASHGWELGFSDGTREVLIPIFDTTWIEAPVTPLIAAMGSDWMEHVFAQQAISRLRRLQGEAVCNALHRVPQRTARWLLTLQQASGGKSAFPITQAMLGRLLGVQRTTINAATRSMERSGLLRFGRGRVTITDPDGLRHLACDCARG